MDDGQNPNEGQNQSTPNGKMALKDGHNVDQTLQENKKNSKEREANQTVGDTEGKPTAVGEHSISTTNLQMMAYYICQKTKHWEEFFKVGFSAKRTAAHARDCEYYLWKDVDIQIL